MSEKESQPHLIKRREFFALLAAPVVAAALPKSEPVVAGLDLADFTEPVFTPDQYREAFTLPPLEPFTSEYIDVTCIGDTFRTLTRGLPEIVTDKSRINRLTEKGSRG